MAVQYPDFDFLMSTLIRVSAPFGQSANDVKKQMLISARQLYPDLYRDQGANAALYHTLLVDWQNAPWWPPAP